MLDIGWTELLVIAIVLIVVVGPKDLPPMLRAFGKMTSNLRKMAGDFRTQFDEALREADMDDVRQTLSDAKSLNPANALRDAINPLRQMGQEIREDLQKATAVPSLADSVTKANDPLLSGVEADAGPAVTAPGPTTVPDTLTSAPDVPARKQRAPRKTAEATASAVVADTAAKPKRAARTVSKVSALETSVPKASKPSIKKPAATTAEAATIAPKKTRTPKKPAAPKDNA